jgi:type II secretory pathway pseudopilin PulG
MKHTQGISLTELAVVLAIIGLLMGSLLVPLSTQIDIANIQNTEKTLEQIKQALINYTLLNGRLPCPVPESNSASGLEVNSQTNCQQEGYLPWANLGTGRYDAWGNPFRYRANNEVYRNTGGSSPQLVIKDYQGQLQVDTDVVAIVYSYGKNRQSDQPETTFSTTQWMKSIWVNSLLAVEKFFISTSYAEGESTLSRNLGGSQVIYSQTNSAPNGKDDILVFLAKSTLVAAQKQLQPMTIVASLKPVEDNEIYTPSLTSASNSAVNREGELLPTSTTNDNTSVNNVETPSIKSTETPLGNTDITSSITTESTSASSNTGTNIETPATNPEETTSATASGETASGTQESMSVTTPTDDSTSTDNGSEGSNTGVDIGTPSGDSTTTNNSDDSTVTSNTNDTGTTTSTDDSTSTDNGSESSNTGVDIGTPFGDSTTTNNSDDSTVTSNTNDTGTTTSTDDSTATDNGSESSNTGIDIREAGGLVGTDTETNDGSITTNNNSTDTNTTDNSPTVSEETSSTTDNNLIPNDSTDNSGASDTSSDEVNLDRSSEDFEIDSLGMDDITGSTEIIDPNN